MAAAVKRWLNGVIPLAVGVAVLCLGTAAFWYFGTPTRFRVAVASQDNAEAKVMVAFARALKETRKDVQLDVVTFDTVRDSALALQERKVDLALVRPDVLLPNDGLTVAILREEAVIIIAPSEDISELDGKRIGVVAVHDTDRAIIRDILAFYDIKPPGVSLLPIPEASVVAAFSAKSIDALAMIAPLDPATATLVTTAFKAAGRKMSLVPLGEGATRALEPEVLQEVAIPEGSFGGQPSRPVQEFKTIGTSYRLMAQATASRSSISEVAEYLFQLRARIAKSAPAINAMKAPEEDSVMSAALPVHPGAIDYLTREQETFMDRYGDWIWLGLFFGGGASSAVAWAFQFFARQRRERIDEVLDRLLSILNEARRTADGQRLDELSCEIDALVIKVVRQASTGATDTRTMSALILAIDAARAAVSDQRRISATGHVHASSGGVHVLGSMRDAP